MSMLPWHGLMWVVACFLFFGDSGSYPSSLRCNFFIVYFVYGFEFLVGGSSCYKLFRKLIFGLRRINLSEWCFVEHKRICSVYCLVFPWGVGLKIHSVLYKVFLNESFSEYLNYVNYFVKSYCVSYSKLVWIRTTILSENGSTVSNLWSDFVSSVFDPS
jgi:hypothetical protein